MPVTGIKSVGLHPDFKIITVLKLLAQDIPAVLSGGKPKLIYCGRTMDENNTVGDYTLSKETCVQLLPEFKQPAPADIRNRYEDILKNKWEQEKEALDGKQCPNCKAVTLKYWQHGCHHITCFTCGRKWCYICRNVLSMGNCPNGCIQFCDDIDASNCGCPVCITGCDHPQCPNRENV